MDELGIAVGRKAKFLLKERGKTVKDLAAYAGMTDVNVYDIFNGKNSLRGEFLVTLATFLGVSSDALLGLVDLRVGDLTFHRKGEVEQPNQELRDLIHEETALLFEQWKKEHGA
jgi:transcriptional regulator with XRE-family HTH domain